MIFKVIIFLSLLPFSIYAQDTVRINYQEYLNKAIELSPILKAEKQKEFRALSRVDEVKANRILPRFDISSNHGVMPGVSSSLGLPRDEWHLDPNLVNEWDNWSVFTKIDFTLAQPVYTWGALTNATEAVKMGAEAVLYQSEMKLADQKMQLTKLYFSAVLANQLERLALETLETFRKAENQITDLEEEGEIEAKELYKFKIYKQQFLIKAEEIIQNKEFVNDVMNYSLGTNSITYIPSSDSMINSVETQSLVLLQQEAILSRPEMKAIKAAEKAASYAVNAQKAQRLPAFFFGLSGEYVHTPRPVQSQPLFGSRFDYINVIYTFGIRQSLNFGVMNAKVAQIEYQQKEAEFSKNAIGQALLVDVANTYKNFNLAKSKKEKLSSALQTSKEWLRKEQIDYDLGLGELKNLVEALKTNLELEAEFKQSVYDFTVKGAAVLKATGKFND